MEHPRPHQRAVLLAYGLAWFPPLTHIHAIGVFFILLCCCLILNLLAYLAPAFRPPTTLPAPKALRYVSHTNVLIRTNAHT